MLEFVVIDGQRASIGEHAHLFPNYFGIDSMSLLLGKNGAGKTRLLQNLAEVLTAGAPLGDQGHWVVQNSDGERQTSDTRYPPQGLGVVYYTPLPYQRPIGSHRRFVNASRLNTNALKQSMLVHFSDVARSLGASTQITASLAYHPSVFERWIVPVLIEMRCQVMDPALEEERQAYVAFRSKGQSQEADSMMRALASRLHEWIASKLDRRGGQLYRVAALATLEGLGVKLKDRFINTVAILSHLELAQFEAGDIRDQSRMSEVIAEFARTLDASLSIAMSERYEASELTNGSIGIQFIVDGAIAWREVENSRSSFQLSWSNLSSGLLSLVEQFARLDVALERLFHRGVKSVLVLVDEGDAYLHLDWQRQYVERLDQFLTAAKLRWRLDSVQAIIATHSPIISGDFPSALVQRLGDRMADGVKTFGSSLDALVLDAFGTPSIGSKAALQIQRLRANVVKGRLTDADQRLIGEIGDQRLRLAVLATPGVQSDH